MNWKRISKFLAFALVIFVVGFLIGSRVGIYQHFLADSQYKAALDSYRLNSLKKGVLKPLITEYEIDLDFQLANHGRYMESKFKWLFPELKGQDQYPIKNAVNYRQNNPYTSPDLSKPDSWKEGVSMDDSFIRNVVEGQKENQKYLKKVLQTYSQK